MKNIKIENLEEALKKLVKDLDLTVEVDEKLIDIYGSCYWGADNLEDYEKQEALISDYKVQGEFFSVYAWCDISGYNYWMKQQEEANYVSIGINVWKTELTEDEVKQLAEAIETADLYFIYNLEDYRHLPIN